MKKIFIIILALVFTAPAHAQKFNLETVGDILNWALPAYALGMTMQDDNWDGAIQLAESWGASQATVFLLKSTIHEERPNGRDNESFPSGHTASAFSGAAFIHKRYGIKKAAIPYALAATVGVSRVVSDWHYTHDVLAGAAIAGLYTWLLVGEYKISVAPTDGGAYVSGKIQF